MLTDVGPLPAVKSEPRRVYGVPQGPAVYGESSSGLPWCFSSLLPVAGLSNDSCGWKRDTWSKGYNPWWESASPVWKAAGTAPEPPRRATRKLGAASSGRLCRRQPPSRQAQGVLAAAIRRPICRQELQEREQRLEAASREYAATSPELAEFLRPMSLL